MMQIMNFDSISILHNNSPSKGVNLNCSDKYNKANSC